MIKLIKARSEENDEGKVEKKMVKNGSQRRIKKERRTKITKGRKKRTMKMRKERSMTLYSFISHRILPNSKYKLK